MKEEHITDGFYSPADVAKALRTGEKRVVAWIESGEMEAVRIAGHWRVSTYQLERFVGYGRVDRLESRSTSKEAAHHLRITEDELGELIASGELEAIEGDNGLEISYSALSAYHAKLGLDTVCARAAFHKSVEWSTESRREHAQLRNAYSELSEERDMLAAALGLETLRH